MSLPAFKVTTASGHSWVTSMAKGVTLADAKKYFLGKRFDISGDPEREKMDRVVKVEEVSQNPQRKWIQKAIGKKGELHRKFGTWFGLRKSERIPEWMYHKGYQKAMRAGDTKTMKRIQLAITLSGIQGRKIRRPYKPKLIRRRRGKVSLFHRRLKRRVANPRRRMSPRKHGHYYDPSAARRYEEIDQWKDRKGKIFYTFRGRKFRTWDAARKAFEKKGR